MYRVCVLGLILAIIPSCGLYVDNRSEIAQTILYEKDGSFNEAALNGLLLSRFPVGSSSSNLEAFVLSFNGKCSQSSESLNCNIIETGTFCAQQSINIEAKIISGTIQALAAQKKSDYC
jgi:hypothetical protein